MKGFSITTPDQQVKINSLFCVLFGMPGVGKTSLSFTAPNGVLHLDFDKGVQRAAPKLRPHTVHVDSWPEFWAWVSSNAFAEYVEQNSIKTIVIDTIGTMLDNSIAPSLIATDPKNGNRNGGLALQGYGALKNSFTAFKNRLQSLGLNVVAVCHSKEVGDEQTRRFEFAVTGGSSDILFQTADLIGYVYAQGEKRIVDWNPSQMKVGKNIGNMPACEIPAPDTNEYDTCLSDIFDRAIASMLQGSEQQKQMQERMADWRAKVDACKEAAAFEALGKEIAEVPDGALKTALRNLFGKAMTAAGVKYNKDTATYEAA